MGIIKCHKYSKYNANPYMLIMGLTILWWYPNTTYVLNGFIPIPLMGMVFTVTGMVMESCTYRLPVNNLYTP